jgi:hypothetical protein
MNIALNTKDSNSIYNVASLVPSSGGSAELVEVTNGASNTLPSSNAFVYGNLSGSSTTTLVLPACSPGLTYNVVLSSSDTDNVVTLSSGSSNLIDTTIRQISGQAYMTSITSLASSVSYNTNEYLAVCFTVQSTANRWVISGPYNFKP